MGGAATPLNFATTPPAVILLAGLQGAGKTTSAAKLARLLKEDLKKKVLLVSCDVYRPAAIAQLQTLAGQVGTEFFPSHAGEQPLAIAEAALDWARKHYCDVVIVDTAGRLAIDEAMMREITQLHAAIKPIETLFVVDAMQGQDAVNTAKAFAAALPLTGHRADQARRRRARWRGAVSAQRDRRTNQVRRRFGKNQRPRGVPSGSHGIAHSRHGRRAYADRGCASPGRRRRCTEARQEGQVGQGLRPRGFQDPDRADAQDGRHARLARQVAGRTRAHGAGVACRRQGHTAAGRRSSIR